MNYPKQEHCPICEYPFRNCQCRFSGKTHPNRHKKRSVVLDHLYMLAPQQIKHIVELQRYWQTSYSDEEKTKILKELEEADYNDWRNNVDS